MRKTWVISRSLSGGERYREILCLTFESRGPRVSIVTFSTMPDSVISQNVRFSLLFSPSNNGHADKEGESGE